MSKMMLHCGAQNVSLDDVLAVTTPQATETWHPIPYGDFIHTVKESLEGVGLGIAREEYGLWGDKEQAGAMFFGLLSLDRGKDDYALAIGLRASHNQRFANSLVAGSRVFVCDNLCFNGEVKINWKNTKFAYRDLVRMVMEAVGRIGDLWTTQEQRYEQYKGKNLTEAQVHDILIRSMDAKAIPNAMIAKVLTEWREPQHDDFQPRTAWSLLNAYTQAYKATNPLDLPARTTRLHGLLDAVIDRTEQQKTVVGELLNGRRAPRIDTPINHGMEEILTTAGADLQQYRS
jgi:hypothetical protein